MLVVELVAGRWVSRGHPGFGRDERDDPCDNHPQKNRQIGVDLEAPDVVRLVTISKIVGFAYFQHPHRAGARGIKA